MMKTILLLTFAVLVSSNPVKHNKTLLGELIDELDEAVKSFSKETEGKHRIFLAELQMDGCKHEVFCQAEQELKTKVSGLSGAKFEHFRTDKKLMRNLSMFNEHLRNLNKHHVKTCKPADDQTEIPLSEFLPKLLTCVKNENSQAKYNSFMKD